MSLLRSAPSNQQVQNRGNLCWSPWSRVCVFKIQQQPLPPSPLLLPGPIVPFHILFIQFYPLPTFDFPCLQKVFPPTGGEIASPTCLPGAEAQHLLRMASVLALQPDSILVTSNAGGVSVPLELGTIGLSLKLAALLYSVHSNRQNDRARLHSCWTL